MDFIFEHFWIVFILVTILNGLILKYRSKKFIKEDPSLEQGYQKFFYGWLFFANIPWVIMGIGNLFGMTENMFEFFFPRDMNPIVLVFHGTIIFLWILSAWWIYFKDGAEFLEQHPGLLQGSSLGPENEVTAKRIKIFFPITILGGIFGMILMWTNFLNF